MITVKEVIARIQKIEETDAIGDIADALGMSRTALANHKRRNTIPYEKIHAYAMKKGLPLDRILMPSDLKKERGSIELYREIRIDDDTMVPTFNPGDLVSYGAIESEKPLCGVYVIDIKGKPAVRRIQEMPDTVLVICDNNLYRPFNYDNKIFEGMLLGRVLCRTTFFDHS